MVNEEVYSSQVLAQTNNIKTIRILTLQKQAIKVMYFSDYQTPPSPLFLSTLKYSHFSILSNI